MVKPLAGRDWAIRIILCGVALLCLPSSSFAAGASSVAILWTTSTVVDAPTSMWWGFSDALAVDSNGVAHAVFNAYMDGHFGLKYATNPGNVWNVTNITSDKWAEYPDIAVDSANGVQVCYYDEGPSNIIYAKLINGSWNETIVGTPDWSGQGGSWAADYPHMTLDKNGKVHIAAREWDANSTLRLITNANGTWNSTGIPQVTNVTWPSITVDSDGHVHVCYAMYNNGTFIVHATNASGTWTMNRYNTTRSLSWSVDSAIDSRGHIHVMCAGTNTTPYAYYYGHDTGLLHLAYDGGSWSEEVVDYGPEVGGTVSMVIDSRDRIHVGYQDGLDYDLIYATDSAGAWSRTRVDSMDRVGSMASIVVDQHDLPRILYYNDTGQSIKFASASEVHLTSHGNGLSNPTTNAGIVVVASAVTIVLLLLFMKPRANR